MNNMLIDNNYNNGKFSCACNYDTLKALIGFFISVCPHVKIQCPLNGS